MFMNPVIFGFIDQSEIVVKLGGLKRRDLYVMSGTFLIGLF